MEVSDNGVIDLSGQRFGKIQVLNRNYEEQNRRGRRDSFWNCRCDCGNEFIKMGWEVKQMTSCGKCYLREEIGKQYGWLVVVKYVGKIPRKDGNGARSQFLCRCQCGKEIIVDYSHLTSGHTQSCGCTRFSQGEALVASVLQDCNIHFKKEFKFNDLKDKDFLRFDFAILDKNDQPVCLIEFDGLQHIKGNGYQLNKNFDQELLLRHDAMKNSYAETHNIPLIRIPYKDKDEEKIKQYLIDYLKGDD